MSSDDELRGLLVQEATTAIVSGADPSRPSARSAHFLLPRAGGARLPALPSPPRNAGPVLGDELPVDWTACPGSSKLWRRWVARLRPRHERLWRKLGILDAVLATTGWVRRDEGLLLQLAAFWSGDTNTFVFPWGEATVTLEDMAVLGGLPLLGRPVWSRLPDELRGDVDALEAARIAPNRCTNKKPSFAQWVKRFVEPPTGEVAAAGRGEAEAATLLEHGAFLAMWLTRYVLPAPPFDVVRPDVFPLAAGLARGRCSALAPAVLANIYNDLSALSHHLSLGTTHQPFVASAPLHILQLWVWERFPELRPETPNTASHGDDQGMPRAVKWHNIRNPLDPGYIHAVLMSPEEFEWRPYGGSSFALPQGKDGKDGCWVHCHVVATSKELQSFAQCLLPCELVGMQCIEHYCPHRVARQLGFDQDVPGTIPRANSCRKTAWATYRMRPEDVSFFVPQRDPGMTVEYAQWWKPYSSACAAAVANAARMKQLHAAVISPRTMKDEGLPAPAGVGDAQDCTESSKDIIMVHNNCGYELANNVQSDTTPSQGSTVNKVTHVTSVDVFVLEGSIDDEVQTHNVTEKEVQRAKVDTESSGVLEGNNDDASCDGLVYGNSEMVKRVISTKTLYYLRPFEWVKDAQVRDSRATNAGQVILQPGREVGTPEMIREASEAREAEKVELETIITRLKEQVVALEMQLRDRTTSKI
ncbi:uncharacterized protein LOC119303303 [Triticum dicoccoides]|uniref:uncharacterized protein LOC119303303 n=1 Tax=Triticum dicoccoides TaxID=85692 RepID=UPI00189040DA|nr:uncharacterized protein LOC119303303 [Triticum dicoccoides]